MNDIKRRVFVILVCTLAFFQFFVSVIPVQAQVPGAPQPVVDVYQKYQDTYRAAKASFEKRWHAAVLGSLVNAASYFARKAAYDAAVLVATGGKGQGPLVFTKNPYNYTKNLLDETAGTAIDSLGQEFGLNLCQIPDPRVRLFLQVGLRRIYTTGPQKPNCKLSDLRKTWSPDNIAKTARERYGDRDALLSRFNADLSVVESDFEVALGAISNIDRIQAQSQAASEVEQLVGSGYKNLVGAISGNIRTPADAIAETNRAFGPGKVTDRSLDQITGIYAAGAKEIIPMASGVFLNTLASKLLDKYLKRGLFPEQRGGSGSVQSEFGLEIQNNRLAAARAFNFLVAATPVKDHQQAFDVISEFATCPDNPGLNNCVIDGNFQQLLDVANTERSRSITIKEAMESGESYLDPNKPLISPRREFEHNNVRECYRKGYCYSNIQKLRKARILPLGFEIAALKSDPDVPWTLGQVVAGFESDCKKSPVGPFCHLIDPNWIIKVPDARCEANVIGPQRESVSIPARKRECADISTCIEGSDGKCLTYGYCTKEKNIWRMAGESCPAQFATCKTYVGPENGTVSYLARTIDYGECTVDSVGCRAYSTEKTGDAWVVSANANDAFKSAGRNQALYLNDRTQTCNPEKDGCTAFMPALRDRATGRFLTTAQNFIKNDNKNDLINAKKAPAYLGCYDTNRQANSPEINWPETRADLNALSDDVRCDKYATACVREEIACDGWKPLYGGGDEEIPGIIGSESCPAQCVGYDTFKQEATNFAPAEYPLHFIPESPNARQCAGVNVGCDEFTNLEDAVGGGESLEYYSALKYCEKPTDTNEKVFYSWEGSREQGFVLKVHRLLQIENADDAVYIRDLNLVYRAVDTHTPESVFPIGSPAYAVDSKASLQSAYNRCNKEIYENLINNRAGDKADADCRALYDETGEIYYRLLAETVSVSTDCRRLRKTESRLEADPELRDEISCGKRDGFWDDGSCQRCYNGGKYQNGVCEYRTIPSQARTCPASANGCRLYIGNTGNNIKQVFLDDFEPAELDVNEPLVANSFAWEVSGPDENIVQEALQVGAYSLRVGEEGGKMLANKIFAQNQLRQDGWYELHFWARGSGQKLAIGFAGQNTADLSEMDGFTKDPVTGAQTYISLGAEWREYSLGPVQFTGDSGSAGNKLVFYRTDGGAEAFFYLDKVRLTTLDDDKGRLYMIKKSWQTPDEDGVPRDVPAVCDANFADGLPGEYLGCKSYRSRSGDVRHATGFTSLCREEAIGCQPLWDTQNTLNGEDAIKMQAWNIWCARQPGQAGEIKDCFVKSDKGYEFKNEGETCDIGATESGCFISHLALPPTHALLPDNIKQGTIIVPADTPDNAPIYLAFTEDTICQPFERGCRMVGAEEQVIPDPAAPNAFKHQETGIINDPDSYNSGNNEGGILCRNDLIGCQAYTSGQTTSYFRDPKKTGNAFCEYRAVTSGAGQFGWFKKGVGECAGSGNLCTADNDCGTGVQCLRKGDLPCYANNIARGGEQGIWSNESAEYKNFVGLCEPEHNACTELLDVNDKSLQYPKGRRYAVIYDDRVTSQVSACEGKVSLKEGCVLFDKTDNPNKVYNAGATYAASAQVEDNFVPAESVRGPMDSNVIVKVERDRVCGEWLACKSSIPQIDKNGQEVNLCYEYKSCNGTVEGKDCTDWVDTSVLSSPLYERLTEQQYIQRNTRWNGMEYSGYSLFNKYQIDKYIYLAFNLSSPELSALAKKYGGTTYLAYKTDPRYFTEEEEKYGCVLTSLNRVKKDWAICGLDDGGRCYDGECIYPIDGSFPKGAGASEIDASLTPARIDAAIGKLTGGTCKAYPEEDSPYPRALVQKNPNGTDGLRIFGPQNLAVNAARRIEIQERNGEYSGASYCQEGNCSCEYTKVTYDNGQVDYWPTKPEQSTIPTGVCSGGTYAGQPCVPLKPERNEAGEIRSQSSDFCGGTAGGVCVPIQEKRTNIGLQGFCLEYDYSRPTRAGGGQYQCLTWLPVDVSASGADIYNTDKDAGYSMEFAGPDGRPEVQGGQVYCLAATGAGRGPYDTFAFNAAADLPDTHVISKYKQQQDWAWQNIGKNAVVLRIEDNVGLLNVGARAVNNNHLFFRSSLSVSDPDHKDDYSINPDEKVNGVACKYCSIFHFAPLALNSQANGYGTVMHPPRPWGAETSGPLASYFKRFLHNNTPNGNSLRVIDSQMMSPGSDIELAGKFFVFGDEDVEIDSVYRSYLEARINEKDLNRVYFTPTGFVNGEDGILPLPQGSGYDDANKGKELYIDFTLLDKIGENPWKIEKKTGYRWEHDLGGVQKAITEGMLVWTYKLTGEQIASFGSYSAPELGAQGAFRGYESNPRNTIAARYVLAWAGTQKGSANTFPFPMEGGLPDESTDPFTIACKFKDEGGYDNWMAVGMDFNSHGEFLGYISRWCNPTSEDKKPDVGMTFSVIATLANQCTEFAAVYDDDANPLTAMTNKAWTQRVWKYNRPNTHPATTYAAIKNDQALSPFGSLPLPLVGSTIKQVPGANETPDNRKNYEYNLRRITFRNANSDGIPYSCVGGRPLGIAGYNLPVGTECEPLSSPIQGVSSIQYTEDVRNTLNGKDKGNADFAIHTLFQRVFATVALEERAGGVNNTNLNLVSFNLTSGTSSDSSAPSRDNLNITKPPVVYSLNPFKCRDATTTCTPAGANNFTIYGGEKGGLNGDPTADYNGDDRPDEDENADGVADRLIGTGSQTVVAQFFAFADDERMPIRRVMMDWDDGDDPLKLKGLYKNRKPYCESKNEFAAERYDGTLAVCVTGDDRGTPTGFTCRAEGDCPIGQRCDLPQAAENEIAVQQWRTLRSDAHKNARFGDLPRACTTGVFKYSHTYTCGAKELAEKNLDGVKTIAVKVSDLGEADLIRRVEALGFSDRDADDGNNEVCVYVPKVQVLDNWGWCNGTAADGSNVGVYNDERSDCDLLRVTRDGVSPWTSYRGKIIVLPVRRAR